MKTTDEQQLWGRVTWRIMPLMVACMIIATIDRSNIGFAKLQMAGSLGLTEVVFGFGASLFYLGYIAFEIPSALASQRFGAPRWFARIMITWGIVTVLLGFTESREGFYLLRFLLGAAEAGLYPAQIFYLSLWFPPERRAGAMGLLTLGSAFGNSMSAVICAPLLGLDAFGLQGWQWIFMITGLMPILMAPVVLAILPRGPQDARFLTDADKVQVQAAVSAGLPKNPAHAGVIKALLTARLIWPVVVYVGLMISLYGVIYWAPSIYKSLNVSNNMNGLLVAIPWLIDAVILLWLPRRLRSERAVAIGICSSALLGAISFAVAASMGGPGLKFLALCVGIPAVSVTIALFWTVPVGLFKGTQAVVAIGFISTIGNLGGFLAQNGMPRLAIWGGAPSVAMWLPAAFMLLVMLMGFTRLANLRSAQERMGSENAAPRSAT